jgi:predicted CoA-substrate-specific enzyme activase
MISIGIDIGSITTKIAVAQDRKILDTETTFTGYNPEKAWRALFDAILARLDLPPASVERVVATGYGRNNVSIAHKSITEILCHAAGARHHHPEVRSVIDIGGQDSKFIRLDKEGEVSEFVMNDKCAAGTGRFLEVIARALEVPLDEFGAISAKARKPAKISSTCTVFAESEVISLINHGEARENIIAGIHESIASRIITMMGRSAIEKPVVMTGGVAKNEGMRAAIEKKLGVKLIVPETSQVNGAIGAALLAQGL